MGSNKSFVEITFKDQDKEFLSKKINSIVPQDKFYYSDVAEHIRGNICHALHCTIFFGINSQTDNLSELDEFIESQDLGAIQIGGLFFINGYQDLYKVLCLEVKDEDNKLKNIHDAIGKQIKRPDPREFKPHLTLAYLTNDVIISQKDLVFPDFLNIDKIQITTVEDFNKRVNNLLN